jgi:hypothetical protein
MKIQESFFRVLAMCFDLFLIYNPVMLHSVKFDLILMNSFFSPCMIFSSLSTWCEKGI